MKLIATANVKIEGRERKVGEVFEVENVECVRSLLESGCAAPAEREARARWITERRSFGRRRSWITNW